jgi:hypothetical protein
VISANEVCLGGEGHRRCARGRSAPEIDAELIEPPALHEDEKAGLWLPAWSDANTGREMDA